MYGNTLLSERDPASSNVDFFHGDHLGSTRLLTDADGGAINGTSFNYSPYGELINGTGSLTNYHFTGQYRDGALSLQYHRARWLNTSLATWLSTDPVFDFPGNFVNAYGYAGMNPVCNTDLSGRFLGEALAITGLIGGLTAINLSFGIGTLLNVGGESGRSWAGMIIQMLKHVGVLALSFLPIIGTAMAVLALPDIINAAIESAFAVGEILGKGDVIGAALEFCSLFIGLLTIVAISKGAFNTISQSLNRMECSISRQISSGSSGFGGAARSKGKANTAQEALEYVNTHPYIGYGRMRDKIAKKGWNNGLANTEKLHAHHILPKYVAEALGYKTGQIRRIPAYPLKQPMHSRGENSITQMIRKELPYGGNVKSWGGIDNVCKKIQKCYSKLGKPHLYDRIEPLIVEVR